jgi:hypothetical protein
MGRILAAIDKQAIKNGAGSRQGAGGDKLKPAGNFPEDDQSQQIAEPKEAAAGMPPAFTGSEEPPRSDC